MTRSSNHWNWIWLKLLKLKYCRFIVQSKTFKCWKRKRESWRISVKFKLKPGNFLPREEQQFCPSFCIIYSISRLGRSSIKCINMFIYTVYVYKLGLKLFLCCPSYCRVDTEGVSTVFVKVKLIKIPEFCRYKLYSWWNEGQPCGGC